MLAGSLDGSSLKPFRPILLFLGVPPPHGGGEIRSGLVAERFRNEPGYRVFRYSRKRGNKSTQGRATVGNLFFGLQYIATCLWLIFRERPKKLFLSLPKNFGAFARTIPVILFASLLRVKVYGELAGARFLFLDGGWQRKIGLFVLRRLHSIRFLGEQIKAAHAEYGFRNPVVFSNGIEIPDDRSHDPVLDEGPLRLLAVGALNRSKGTGRIIEAVALCREQGLDVCCTLVGEWSDPALKTEMELFAQERGLSPFICFAGLIKGAEKWNFFRQAHILVHPTEWDGQPLTILEAIGMGLTVISTPVGAIPDTVTDGKNGILLQENSPDALVQAIRRLYEDRGMLKRMMEFNRADFDGRFTIEAYLHNFKHWMEII